MKRLPNGYGGVSKYKGNRKNPYRAWIPKKIVNTGSLLSEQHKDVEEIAEIIRNKEFTNKSFESELKELIKKYSKEELEVKTKRITLGYYPTYQDALNSLAEYNRMPIDGEIKSMTFADVWNTIKAKKLEGLKDITKYSWNKGFSDCVVLHNKKITSLRTIDMQRVIDEVAERSPTMQKNIVQVCNAVFEYAVENDIVQKNYAEFLTMKAHETGEKTIYSDEEILSLWEHLDDEEQGRKALRGIKAERIMLLMIYTGIRIAELLAIKKEDIHIEERYIDVHGTKTKSADRKVPIHKDIIHLLECKEYLIEKHDGTPVSYYSSIGLLKDMNKKLNQSHTFHEARHTFISRATGCNLNEALIHKIVGHSGTNLEQRVYLHAEIKDLVREIDKLVLPVC